MNYSNLEPTTTYVGLNKRVDINYQMNTAIRPMSTLLSYIWTSFISNPISLQPCERDEKKVIVLIITNTAE